MTIGPPTPLPHIPLICVGAAARKEAVIEAVKMKFPQFELDRQDVALLDEKLLSALAEKKRIVLFDNSMATREDVLGPVHLDDQSLLIFVGEADKVSIRVRKFDGKIGETPLAAIDDKTNEFVEMEQIDAFIQKPEATPGVITRVANYISSFWTKK